LADSCVNSADCPACAQDKRRKEETANKALEQRHRAMRDRVAEMARMPTESGHVAAMRGGGGGSAEQRIAALGPDDALLLRLFDTIREFAAAPDCTPPKRMPSALSGFQRAMVHQVSPRPAT